MAAPSSSLRRIPTEQQHMKVVQIELHFLPSIEYFCALRPHETVLLEKHEHFVKQSYRSRCYILAANRVELITLPLTAKRGKVRITDVQLDTGNRWKVNFWRTITSAYSKSPYFEHYADELKAAVVTPHRFLYDLNLQILSLCLNWLRWKTRVDETTMYEKESSGQILDLRNVISAKNDFRERPFYQPSAYQQVFGNAFVPNLSMIDLVFCEGPRAAAVVEESRRRV